MGVSIEQNFNSDAIKKILTKDSLWDAIAEDGQDKDEFEVDLNKNYFLSVNVGETCIGLYILHAFNGATMQIHANILPEYRKHAKESGKKVLEWFQDNASDKFEKIIALIPVIYPKVYHFTKNRGFTDEGLITKAYRKNGRLIDIHILGLERYTLKRE